MIDELDWLRELEQDVQRLRGHTDISSRENNRICAVTANNLATGLKIKINERIIELLEVETTDVS